ncbi:MAG: hypothetical protein IH594_10190 [Bacteroidales bacterium]|nr:hypothetical protein [Bacteroidales bacterium]
MSKNVIFIGAAVVLVIVIAGVYFFNLGSSDLSNAEPDYHLTATELYSEFSSNETRASDTYIDKVIDVTGTVLAKETLKDNIVNISLDSGNPFGSVICTFSGNPEDVLSNIEIGDSLTIRGICSGMLMDVLMNNCVLVKSR